MRGRDELAVRWVPRRVPSLTALREQLEAQRRLLAGLGAGAPPDPRDVALAGALADEVAGWVDGLAREGRPDPAGPLAVCFEQWDVLRHRLEAPARASVAGGVLGLGQRAAFFSLRPLYTELLRPQRSFNRALADALGEALVLRDDEERRAALSPMREVLSQAWDPTAFQVRSHRQGLVGQAAQALKRGGLTAVAPALAETFERLGRYNREAAGLLLAFLEGQPLTNREVHARLGSLRRLGRAPRGGGRAWPLWGLLLRRQERFAAAATATLGALFGLPRRPDDDRIDYPDRLEAAEAARRVEVEAALATLNPGPLFSVVTPVFRTPAALLEACVASVKAQLYPRWELVLVDDASGSASLSAHLERLAREDERIRVVALGANQGIAGATNAGLAQARGEWVGLLDHDDELAPTALAEVALAMAARPRADVFYSDEDLLSSRGQRIRPFFKPGWSPELLRSVNYVCHFLVVRRTLLEAVGGLSLGFDGAQDYELLLRLSERTDQVVHLPHLLYRWRAAPGSTAQDINNKPAAQENGIRALQAHLARTGTGGTVSSPIPTHYAVSESPPPGTTVSVVVLAAGPVDVSAVLGDAPQVHEVLVASADPVPIDGRTESPLSVRAVVDARPLAAAVRLASGEVVVVVHEDVRASEEGWLQQLAGVALRRSVGLVGPKVLNPDGTIQSIGLESRGGALVPRFASLPDTNPWTSRGHPDWATEVDALPSCAFAFARDRWREDECAEEAGAAAAVARLGEAFRARGLRVVVTPLAQVEHHPHDACPDV